MMREELKNLLEPIQPALERVQQIMQQAMAQKLSTRVAGKRDFPMNHGKALRAVVLLWSGCETGKKWNVKFYRAAAALEMLHAASLIHDDILDHAAERRGKPTLHVQSGLSDALLYGDLLLATAFELSASTGETEVVKALSRGTAEVCLGEIKQNARAFHLLKNTEEYMKLIGAKTASLFAEAAMMGGILAGFPKKDCLHLKKFGFNLGLAFQILDDCLDLAPRKTGSGKDSYRDLPEGKVTLPVLLMLKRLAPAARRRLESVLFSKKARDKRHILTALEETEAIPRSLAEVESLLVQGQKMLDRVSRLKYHKELQQLVLLFKNPLVD